MNKLFTKIAALALGAVMAVGVGVAVANGSKAQSVSAASYSSVSSIAAGDVVVFAYEKDSTRKELTGVSSSSIGTATNYSTNGSPNGTYKLTVETGYGGTGFSFKNGSNYLCYTSGSSSNSLYTSTTKNNYSTWTLKSGSSAGSMRFVNAGNTARQLVYNASSPRWCCYTSNQTGFIVYKYSAIFVTSITLNKSSTTLNVGDSETLSVSSVLPDNADDKTYTWSSTDSSVASVSNGVVTANAVGTATIKATAKDGSGVHGDCLVTVQAATTKTVVDVLSVESAPKKIAQGKSIDADRVKLNVSFDEGPNGVVTATDISCTTTAVGNVTATATYSSATGTKTADWTIEVVDGTENRPYDVYSALKAMDSSEDGDTIASKFTIGKISEITTAYNSKFGNVSFNLSEDGSTDGDQLLAYRCASANADDTQVGDLIKISGTIKNYGGTIEYDAGATFVHNQPSLLSITGGTTIYNVGQTFAWDSTAKVTWTLDGLHDEAVSKSTLSFNFAEGTAFTKSNVGAKTITVTYTDPDTRLDSVDGTLNLTIKWADATGIVLDKGSAQTIILNSDITITATVLDQNLAEQKVEWSYTTTLTEDDDYEVVDDDTSCLLYSKSTEGTITITATSGSVSASCVITISGEPTIALDKGNLSGKWTGDVDDVLIAEYANFGSNTPTITWSSSNENVVTVAQDTEEPLLASVHYVGAGNANITVTATYGSKHPSASCSVSVSQSAITGITLSNSEENIYTNDPFTLTVTGYTKAGGNETEGVTWETSDEAIATVANGVVTGVSAGDVTITARSTYTNTVTASCLFHVTQTTMTLSWTDKGVLSFYVGDSITLNEGAKLTTKYNNTNIGTNGNVSLTLTSPGVSAFLKDGSKPEVDVDLATYTFKKSDNGLKLGFKYDDGVLQNKTSSYVIEVINWRNVSEDQQGNGSFDFSLMASSSGNVLTESAFTDSMWSSTTGLSKPSVSSINRIYGQDGFMGLGSNGNAGSLTFTFSKDISSISISFTTWSGKKITVTNCTDIIVSGTDSESSPATRTLSSATKNITIASDNRIKINSITFSFSTSEPVGKTEDCLNLERFIDTYLRSDLAYDPDPTLPVNNTDECKSLYSAARKAFNNEEGAGVYALNDHQRLLFATNSAYINEYARLTAWALVNNDSFNSTTHKLNSFNISPLPLVGSNAGTNTVAIITIIMIISTGAVGGYFFIRKRKEQ